MTDERGKCKLAGRISDYPGPLVMPVTAVWEATGANGCQRVPAGAASCALPHTQTPFYLVPSPPSRPIHLTHTPIMTIEVGSTVPSGTFAFVDNVDDDPSICGKPQQLKTDEWKGKKIVLFGVPGAFTPTCSEAHLPGYLEGYERLQSKGVDAVYCIASNDVFVVSAWQRALKAGNKLTCISDATLTWLESAGLVQDLSHVGFGKRSKRFAAIINDLKASLVALGGSQMVEYIGIEEGGGVTVSGAEAVLAKL
ncbi:BQ2448_1347 [Microbotryum intermedium]|uniref:BQ2448_1347 protein n=1 Tax=Microbotryum intermedium TaxID=269621 RepID=A0A238FD58_9BASI|nr:BQ2448_1347 [Microbotryum intermedium]